jgi:hypothetical protein
VLRTKIVMYSDYNESTRRFKNLGRIEDFWDQEGKFSHGKEVVAISVAACYGLIGLARGKNACMFATVVDDVAT